MAKLFVFAIGGTGSRVLRSLTMLFASGVRLPHGFDTIVPIIIDPDSSNGDLNRTADILLKYQQIKSAIGISEENDNFFRTNIRTLRSLADEGSPRTKNNFLFPVVGADNLLFGDYLNYNGLPSGGSKDLIDLLYTKQEINSNLKVGFKGKPNIGSIVLNKLIQTDEYEMFARNFNQGDAIFIISSIFGGTGASGFPMLLKNLRKNDPKIPNSNLISDAKIGAISFLPYFNISKSNDENQDFIDSTSFSTKAKAALSYYKHAIFDNYAINSFYYLSDKSDKEIPHHIGGNAQKNNAHFLELVGAISIIDFLKDIPNLGTVNGKAVPGTDVSKEYGVESTERILRFSHLGPSTKGFIRRPLVKFALLDLYFRKALSLDFRSNTTWVRSSYYGKEENRGADFYKDLETFLKSFHEWMNELLNNEISFQPFHEKQEPNDLLNFVSDNPIKNTPFWKKASSGKVTNALNNAFIEYSNKSLSNEKLFIKMFDVATENIVNKFNY